MAEDSKFNPELVQLVKRTRFNPIRTLTPDTLSKQLDSFAVGFVRDFAITADAIRRRDDVISVTLPKREKAVSRRGYAIHVNDGLEGAAKTRADEHAAALKYFYDNLTASHVLEGDMSGGFRLLVRQMMVAVGFKYAVHEIIWQPRMDGGKPRLTANFNFVPLEFFESRTGKLRFVRNYIGQLEGEEMQPDEWLVTIGEGIMEPLSVAYMFKQLSLKDWVAYSEKFGTPGILGKTNSAKDSDAWNALVDAVAEFSQDFAAVVNQESTIDLIEAKGGATLPFPTLVDRMDRAIATICRGADLSTMSAGAGQGQGASVQGEEAELLEQDDAEMISETLLKVSRIVIRQLFNEEPLAYLKITVPKAKNNADTRANILLLRDSGVEIGQEWTRAELGVPAPTEGELTLVKPAAPQESNPFAAANASEKGKEAIFRSAALQKLSKAQGEALRPFTHRLAEIVGIEDPDTQDAALVKLQADIPKLYRQVAGDPALAAAFEEILGTALTSGAATAAQQRKKA